MKRYLQTSALIMACVWPVSLYTAGPAFAAESSVAKENLEKLKTTKSCKGCDLSGSILNRLDLMDADLEGADLSSAKISLTNLTRANLRNTNLRGAVFGGSDLSDADLRGADLRGTSLDSSYHQGARFDGEFIVTKPSEEVGETEVPKEVFIADPVKPKQSPETSEAQVGDRRGPETPTTTTDVVREVKPEAAPKVQGSTEERQNVQPAPLAAPPAAKKIAPVQQAVVDVTAEDETVSATPVASPVPAKEEPKKPVLVTPAIAASVEKTTENVPVQNGKESISRATPRTPNSTEAKEQPAVEAPVRASVDKVNKESAQQATLSKSVVVAQTEGQKEKKQATPAPVEAPKSAKSTEEKPIVASGNGGASNRKSPAEQTQQENLTRLLDKNRCYGCDLSGLDLSGKNLDSADLEKANLSGCNLEKVDLDKANLKSAVLVKANLRQASLKNADFYKADLTGADFTGAKVQGAMFDSAQTASALGLSEAIGAAGK